MKTIGNFEFENLVASGFPTQTAIVKVASGQGILSRGSILGKAENNSIILVGGETTAVAQYILADVVDTTDAPSSTVSAVVYVSGAFNRNCLVVAKEGSVDEHEESLKKFGIYLKEFH